MITAAFGVATQWKYEPTLDSLPNFTDFTNLYDQYCIKAIKVSLFPKFSQVEGVSVQDAGAGLSGLGAVNLMGQVASVVDIDGNGPTTMNELMQYQNVKMTRGNKIHSRYFKPAVAASIFKSTTALTSAYGPKKSVWLDCSNPDVTHYGLYGIIDLSGVSPSFVGAGFSFDVKVDMYIACKNVR